MKKIVKNYSMKGHIERKHIMDHAFRFVEKNKMQGDYWEFGCFQGESLLKASHAAKKYKPETKFSTFDSFEGLPELSSVDKTSGYDDFKFGEYAASLDDLKRKLTKAGFDLNHYVFFKGFFNEVLPTITHEMKAPAVVHIDCDLQSSAEDVLEFLTNRFQDGTLVLFDDYFCYRGNPKFGVRAAFINWTNANNVEFTDYMHYGWSGAAFILHKNL